MGQDLALMFQGFILVLSRLFPPAAVCSLGFVSVYQFAHFRSVVEDSLKRDRLSMLANCPPSKWQPNHLEACPVVESSALHPAP